jgi:hypothetical protein
MREYRIKRGHKPDLEKLISEYYGVNGDVFSGTQFNVDGIGDINIKQEKNSIFIDIVPPKTLSSDYSIIKKWNEFLFEATGKTVKERKKEFGKI